MPETVIIFAQMVFQLCHTTVLVLEMAIAATGKAAGLSMETCASPVGPSAAQDETLVVNWGRPRGWDSRLLKAIQLLLEIQPTSQPPPTSVVAPVCFKLRAGS